MAAKYVSQITKNSVYKQQKILSTKDRLRREHIHAYFLNAIHRPSNTRRGTKRSGGGGARTDKGPEYSFSMGIVGREKMVSHCRALSEKRSYLVFPELTTSLSPKQKIFFFRRLRFLNCFLVATHLNILFLTIYLLYIYTVTLDARVHPLAQEESKQKSVATYQLGNTRPPSYPSANPPIQSRIKQADPPQDRRKTGTERPVTNQARKRRASHRRRCRSFDTHCGKGQKHQKLKKRKTNFSKTSNSCFIRGT